MALRLLSRPSVAIAAASKRTTPSQASRASSWFLRRHFTTTSQPVQDPQTNGAIASTHTDQEALHIRWTAYLWLRDNCRCPQCIHPSSGQKLHSSADVPLDIAPESVTIKGNEAEIVWDKPLRHQLAGNNNKHVSTFPVEWLERYASREASETYRFNNLPRRTWASKDYKLKWVHYDDYMNTEQGLHEVVQRMYNTGLVFLDQVPISDESVTKVAERIGPVQETFYGRDFDVVNVAKARNVAYTSLYLGFHMDLMYLDCPPGIQLLHSLKNTVTGGASIFVDSYHAVEMMKEQHPEDYEVLTKTPVTFHYVNDGHHMYYRRPTIVTGEKQSGPAWDMHVNYAPQFQGPMDHLSAADAKKFYRAFQRFADFIENDTLRFQLTLKPGQLVMFANRRVLHGRTAFDPSSGDRHLKGTYIALDSLKDNLRVLCEKYGFDSSV
ncbi:hypothetical protein BX666DRAFT_2019901 [Dichotomocladium elegans]|nr:hypothetical protein BX666DRAFT_2019901 [Dichotomocladium elegans]